MATQAGGFIQDQNLNVHFDVAPSGMKTSKPQKNGGLGGRKALGDISNSRRPSTLQPLNKLSSKNVIAIEEDIVPAIVKSSFGEKAKVSSKAVGRKALGDLTNAVKPRVIQESKKAQDKKLSAVVEEPFPLNSEGINEHFLHDHRKCIKAQEKAKALELDYFLKEYGIGNSTRSSPPRVPPAIKTKPESPIRFPEREEMPEPLYKDTSQWNKYEVSSEETLSPVSPPRFQWDEYFLSCLELKGTP